MTVLASRQNIGLDSRDIINWFNFDRVTAFGPQLALLSLFEGTSISEDIGNIITVATLATEGGASSVGQLVEYQTVGRLPEPAPEDEKTVHTSAPIHFVISDGVWMEKEASLSNTLVEHRRKVAARVPKDQSAALAKVGAGATNGVRV